MKGYYEYDPIIYPRKLWIHIGKDLESICSEFEDIELPEREYYGVTYANVMRKNDNKCGVLISFESDEAMTTDVCAHECSHACDGIEEALDMDHGGEPSAYLIGWIASCVKNASLNIGKFIELC